MILISYRIFLVLLLSLALINPSAYGQSDPVDTIELSRTGKNAQADQLFFSAMKDKIRGDDKQAGELLEQYIKTRPDVSAAYYELSKLSYKNKNLEKAETFIKKAIELDAKNKWYREQYASILADRGSFTEAAKIMADLSVTEPQDPIYLITAAEYYEHAKKYTEAISFLDKALEQNTHDEDIMIRKMQLYLNMNDVDKAAGVVEQLIAQEPQNGKYYKLLAELYDNNKQPAKATAVYERARKTVPNDPSVQLGIAEHYLKSGDSASYVSYVKKLIVNNELDAETQLDLLRSFMQSLPNDTVTREQAIPLMRQLLMQHPSDPEVIAYYGALLEPGSKHDSAIILFKKSLALKPGNYGVWEKLLESSTRKEDADSLIKYSERALRLFPNLALIHYFNGVGHLNKKEYTAATKAINRAIDLLPEKESDTRENMYSLLGEIYNNTKQYELSDEAFEKALKLAPNNTQVLNNYSYFLSERGVKLDEAEQMSRKSLELKPGDGTFLDTYGWILYKKGNYAKAKEYLQKAVDAAGQNADAAQFDHLGDVYYKLNEKQKAIENWKISKQKGGDSPLLDKKISEGKLYE
jgi:Tfp pilus assembly protein PilF